MGIIVFDHNIQLGQITIKYRQISVLLQMFEPDFNIYFSTNTLKKIFLAR